LFFRPYPRGLQILDAILWVHKSSLLCKERNAQD